MAAGALSNVVALTISPLKHEVYRREVRFVRSAHFFATAFRFGVYEIAIAFSQFDLVELPSNDCAARMAAPWLTTCSPRADGTMV